MENINDIRKKNYPEMDLMDKIEELELLEA